MNNLKELYRKQWNQPTLLLVLTESKFMNCQFSQISKFSKKYTFVYVISIQRCSGRRRRLYVRIIITHVKENWKIDDSKLKSQNDDLDLRFLLFGRLNFGLKKYAVSISYYEQALDVIQKIYGSKSNQLISVYQSLGRVSLITLLFKKFPSALSDTFKIASCVVRLPGVLVVVSWSIC